MVHLLSLGGWIRDLEIGTASVVADFLPDQGAKLRQFDFSIIIYSNLTYSPHCLRALS